MERTQPPKITSRFVELYVFGNNAHYIESLLDILGSIHFQLPSAIRRAKRSVIPAI